MATQVLVVTTPDVLALRGVRRMRDLWKRLSVREDDDIRIVLNQASRRREIQPDLARKVVGDGMTQTTIPADFNALEAAVNTGSPSRMEDNKLRGAFEALANELEIVPRADEVAPRDDEPRGLLARLGGERGQTTVEFVGMLPLVLVTVILLWQIALTGYTFVAAGHAAREGARELATDPTDAEGREAVRATATKEPYNAAAREDLTGAWRKHAEIELRGDVTVSVRLRVPIVVPGLGSPLMIGSTADAVLEDGDLSDRQDDTDAQERLRRGRELELMLRRLLKEERGQARPSSWACSGCCSWARCSSGRSCSWRGRPIRPPTPRGWRRASRRATATPRRRRTGPCPRACATA